MHSGLVKICDQLPMVIDFLYVPTKEKEAKIDQLFEEFMECFKELREEKLRYPKEFITDTRLYNEGYEPIHKKFEDKEIRFLMLSDFYDFVRLTKKYKPKV